MKQKQPVIFTLIFFIFVLTSFYYFLKQEETPVSADSIALNYDYIMKNDSFGQNKTAQIDYYTLVLSWSPSFCHQQRQRYGENQPKSIEYQCGTSQYFGWIIHGLWPQNGKARRISDHPRFCQGDLPIVDQAIIKKYLANSPSAHLLQGEWEKHGACAFKEAEHYFQKQDELYRSLRLPNDEFVSKTELFRWLKKYNPQLQKSYLRAHRHELFICYDLSFNVIDCPKSTGYEVSN